MVCVVVNVCVCVFVCVRERVVCVCVCVYTCRSNLFVPALSEILYLRLWSP